MCPEPSAETDLPRPTVELIALEKMVSAYLRSVSPKQGRRFLRCLAEEFSDTEETVVPFLQREAIERRISKERGSLAWMRDRIPVWLVRADR